MDEKPPKRCWSCGLENEPGSAFCRFCGVALTPGAATDGGSTSEETARGVGPPAYDVESIRDFADREEPPRYVPPPGSRMIPAPGLRQARRRAKGTAKPLAPLPGLLVVAGLTLASGFLAVVFLQIAAGASIMGLLFGGYGGLGIAGIITLLLAIGVIFFIPFFLGALIDGLGWLLGASISLVILFLIVPWVFYEPFGHAYMWVSNKLDTPLWCLIALVPLCAAAGWFGYRSADRRGWRKIRFSSPNASVAPVLVACIVLATAGMPVTDTVHGNRDRAFSDSEYDFKLVVPKGWEVHTQENPSGSSLEEQAQRSVTARAYHGSRDYPAGVDIHVYSKMPFVGKPLTWYPSGEAVLEELRRRLPTFLATPPEDGTQGGQTSVTWSGTATIGGVKGLGVKVTGRGGTGTEEGILVYRAPFLYYVSYQEDSYGREAQTGVGKDTYRRMLASFRFTGSPGAQLARDQVPPFFKWTVLQQFHRMFLNDVWAMDASHVWVAGSRVEPATFGGGYHSLGGTVQFYDGKDWREVFRTDTPPSANDEYHVADLTAVAACDPQHIWAGGHDGKIYFSDGASWLLQADLGPAVLQNMFALDPAHVWAVGGNETDSWLYFYDGRSWSRQLSVQLPDAKKLGFTDVFALDPAHVWTVSTTGFHFFDGRSWSLQWTDSGATHDVFVQGVAASDVNHVWATSKIGDVYSFDGTAWRKVEQPGAGTSGIWCLAVADRNCVWAAGKPDAVRFFDGRRWSTQEGEDLEFAETASISAADPDLVFMVREQSIYRGVREP